MNILLLGNGFDINYSLPTKYINFLNTVHYLTQHSDDIPQTIGEIFGADDLRAVDKDIDCSYKKYQTAYSEVSIDETVIAGLRNLGRNNIWFKYLYASTNRDIGWIDFEKEIGTVIGCFREFLEKNSLDFTYDSMNRSKADGLIIRLFDFFSNPMPGSSQYRRFADDYISVSPIDCAIKQVDKERIIKQLASSLLELAEGLKAYLLYFVDGVVAVLTQEGILTPLEAFSATDQVVSFNYTNTYEYMSEDSNVFHIHGNVDSNIVLGINPDDSDSITSIDTTFLRFKKYFQRAIYHSEDEYIEWYTAHRQKNGSSQGDTFSLLVMGHSLDITDKDIITELFDISDSITILYYNEGALASMVTNLVQIFGKDQFTDLRRDKHLCFLHQSGDCSKLIAERAKTSGTHLQRFVEALL